MSDINNLYFTQSFSNQLSKIKNEVDEYTDKISFNQRFKFFCDKFEDSFDSGLRTMNYDGICTIYIYSPLHIDVKEEIDKLLKVKGFTENKNLDNMLDYYFEKNPHYSDRTIFYFRKYKKCDVPTI